MEQMQEQLVDAMEEIRLLKHELALKEFDSVRAIQSPVRNIKTPLKNRILTDSVTNTPTPSHRSTPNAKDVVFALKDKIKRLKVEMEQKKTEFEIAVEDKDEQIEELNRRLQGISVGYVQDSEEDAKEIEAAMEILNDVIDRQHQEIEALKATRHKTARVSIAVQTDGDIDQRTTEREELVDELQDLDEQIKNSKLELRRTLGALNRAKRELQKVESNDT